LSKPKWQVLKCEELGLNPHLENLPIFFNLKNEIKGSLRKEKPTNTTLNMD
jgi:hypothetical protein